ncbi:MAG: extracellular catalytic domain type 1 short-chain-length polyhydroxyalkanoate depolymerase, partial [Candidatus Hodarchaeales archaeon]
VIVFLTTISNKNVRIKLNVVILTPNKKQVIFGVALIIISILMVSIFIFLVPSAGYEHMIVNGKSRSYLIRLPANYSKEVELPLVLALHGASSDAKKFESNSGFTELAEKENFIVVYPNGNGPLPYSLLTWNAGYCCYYSVDNNIDDLSFIKELLDHVQNTYAVDATRIYVTGHSNGGIMTYLLAAEISERITAIATVAGSIGGKKTTESETWIIPKPKEALPVLHFHGTADNLLSYEGGHGVETVGTRIDLSVKETISFWTDHNNCSAIPDTTVGDGFTIDHYTGGVNGTEVILYTMINGTHIWPGSELDPLKPLSATKIIWEFFRNHSKYVYYKDGSF